MDLPDGWFHTRQSHDRCNLPINGSGAAEIDPPPATGLGAHAGLAW